MSDVTLSATLQCCSTSIRHPVRRLGQQLRHFQHRLAENDLRRPTSAGLAVDEIAPVGCVPHPATDMALVQRKVRGELAEGLRALSSLI